VKITEARQGGLRLLLGLLSDVGRANRFTFGPGFFGENLSVTELPEDEVGIGDVFSVGETEVQVSQPRQPCHKLSKKIGDLSFFDHVIKSGWTGFYFRVLREGHIQTGFLLSPGSSRRARSSMQTM